MTRPLVIIANLGTPEKPETKEVATYLREFLGDRWVLRMPAMVRLPLVHGFIVPFRASRSAEKYQKVWMSEGSPLLVYSQRLQNKLKAALQGSGVDVELAMRYGEPSLKDVIQKASRERQRVLLVPLYPQYAESTVRTSVEWAKKHWTGPKDGFDVLPPFYHDQHFLNAQSLRIQQELDHFAADHLLLSYHAIPENHLRKADGTGHCMATDGCCFAPNAPVSVCYRAQCLRTSQGISERIQPIATSTTFQSRLGPVKWTGPQTVEVVAELAKKGVKRIAVACPSFVADCLETLEEVAMEVSKVFRENGGEELRLIACLNDMPEWVEALQKIVLTHLNQKEATHATVSI